MKLTDIGHFLGGLITSFTAFLNPVLAAILFICFVIYELDEDWRIRDGAWKDIRVYAIGLFLGAALCLAARYLCHHLSMG